VSLEWPEEESTIPTRREKKMRRLVTISMLLLTLCNVSVAVAYACICSDPRLGTACTGTYCRTRPGGGCECQDVPFAAFAEVESGNY
jgi:hypothetical protein